MILDDEKRIGENDDDRENSAWAKLNKNEENMKFHDTGKVLHQKVFFLANGESPVLTRHIYICNDGRDNVLSFRRFELQCQWLISTLN